MSQSSAAAVAAAAAAAVQTSPFISELWRVQGPLLRAAFATLHTDEDLRALCDRLDTLLRRGVYKHLEAELPAMFAQTGRPHAVLAQLLTNMEPRITTAKHSANNNHNGKGPKQSAGAGATVAMDACPCPCPAPAAAASEPLPATWFTALLSLTPLVRIGNSHHHSLQVLLLSSVAKLCNGASGSADGEDEGAGCPVLLPEDVAYAREVLAPRWFAVPAVLQHVLTLYHHRLTWPEQRAYFLALQQAGHMGDAAAWVVHWNAVCHVDPSELLLPLLHRSAPQNSEVVAIELAHACPSLRDPLVRLLTSVSHRSPTALKCIQRWGMDVALFPEVTHDLATRQLRWLVREGKAEELGPEVCGESPQLRRALVQELVNAGEIDDAQKVFDMFELQDDAELAAALQQAHAARAADPSLQQPSKRAQAAAAAGPFLQLPASVPIVFVTASDPSSLDAAEAGLSERAADLVGLDVEFGFTGSSSTAPALLQIATRRAAFLFDLLCFDQCPRMAAILLALFRSPSILKVGYAWDGDWRVLHQGFPGAACFASQTEVVDMADAARALDRLEAMRDARVEAEARRAAQAAEEADATAAAAAAAATAGEMAADAGGVAVAAGAIAPSPSPDLDESLGDFAAEVLKGEVADELDENEAAVAAAAAPSAGASATAPMEDDDNDDDEAEGEEGENDDAADAPMQNEASAQDARSIARARQDRRRAKKAAKKAARSSITPAAAADSAGAGAAPASATGGAGAGSGDSDAAPVRRGVARGLSALAHLCLGLPLDKHFQISAWRRRPLKPAQMHYAALDAWCLLAIHDAFFGSPRLPLLDELGLPGIQAFLQRNATATAQPAAAAQAKEVA